MEIYSAKKKEISLLKYALNSITLERKDDEYILSVTERFRSNGD